MKPGEEMVVVGNGELRIIPVHLKESAVKEWIRHKQNGRYSTQYDEEAEVTQSNTGEVIKVSVDIRPGPASQAQKATYWRFWAKLISQVKDELDNEQNPKPKRFSSTA